MMDNKKIKRKELINRLKKEKKIYDEDYIELEKDLDKTLIKKKALLISLLFEKELLQKQFEKIKFK